MTKMDTSLLRFAPLDVELSQRIHWLIQLRWLAASAVLYLTFMSVQLLGLPIDPVPLYLIGAAIAGYNSLFSIGLKLAQVKSAPERFRQAKFIAHGQIVLDLFFLTLLIHFSGGVETPLAFFFIFHVIIASILLSRLETFAQVTVANVLFGGLVLGEYAGVIPHVDFIAPNLAGDGLFVTISLLVFASTLYLAAYMATSIVSRLLERDREALALAQQLEEKALELEGACEQLTQLERLKSEYLRKASHGVRTPLETIQSTLMMVLENMSTHTPLQQTDRIVAAVRQTEALLRLTDDLLMLSRTREARLFTARERVSLPEVAQSVVAANLSRATARHVELRSDLPGELPFLYADPDAVEQLLSNLVSNALNYTPAAGSVEITASVVGDTLEIRVSDTGIGIPSAEIPKIFNEFYRAENARRFREEGTGLGLSIVRAIVDAHGGEIDVKSQVGFGTTFTVLLPVKSDAARVSASEQATTVQARSRPGSP
jgi:signal transduction histidine kinase